MIVGIPFKTKNIHEKSFYQCTDDKRKKKTYSYLDTKMNIVTHIYLMLF